MEIEGIINHTLCGLYTKNQALKDDLAFCDHEIHKWNSLRKIHANEEVQSAIQGLKSVRQLLSEPQYMNYFIGNSPEETFYFMGFHMEAIQFYIELRNSFIKFERYAKENLSVEDL